MADAKKYVFKVDVHDEVDKSKAMKAVAGFHGIDSLSVDIKDKKMTLIGIVDPVEVVRKLRKRWPHVGILTVGPAKEPEKKPETDKAGDKDKGTVDPIAEWIKLSQAHNPHMIMHHWIPTAEEHPNACLIM